MTVRKGPVKDFEKVKFVFKNRIFSIPGFKKGWLQISIDGKKKRIEKYYDDGVEKYTQEKLTEAINLWYEVPELDPGHQKAKEFLNKLEN